MAISGGTANVFSVMRRDDGFVVVTGPHRMAGHLVQDEKRAKEAIEAGKTAIVPAYGNNPQLLRVKYAKEVKDAT